MHTVRGIADAGMWDGARAVDRVVLDAGDRVRRRIVLTTEGGMKLLLDFAEPMMLRDGDGLVLDDGVQLLFGLLEVVAHAVFFLLGLLCGGAEFVRRIEEIGGRKDGKEGAHTGSLAVECWTNRAR